MIVSGFTQENSGIGRAGRLSIAGLSAIGLSPKPHDLRPLLSDATFGSEFLDTESEGGVWLIHCNPEEAITAASRIRRTNWQNRFRIGYWAYELPRAPKSWLKLANFFHEIWVPSTFVAESLRGIKRPVVVMPHFSVMPPATDPEKFRNRLGIGESTFVVGAAGDFLSSLTRKNLIGAVHAFLGAFPEPAPDRVRLIVKIRNREASEAAYTTLSRAVAGRADIIILDKNLSDGDVSAFVAALNVFLSPHRSEGYGLMLAEALSMDIPVLATGWSGNMEYMTGIHDALIPFKLSRVEDENGVYLANGDEHWADPDVQIASEKLLRIFENEAIARKICHLGRANLNASNDAWALNRISQMNWYPLASRS
ncbi:MAG: glycosyltransferase [Pseudomonadota bacterium]